MKALKNTLLVSINPNEKSEVFIGGSAMLSGKQYSDNFREKTPVVAKVLQNSCLLYTSPSPRDRQKSRMPSSA